MHILDMKRSVEMEKFASWLNNWERSWIGKYYFEYMKPQTFLFTVKYEI